MVPHCTPLLSLPDRGADDVSLDHLSRLLVDVHQDSSKIMNDLLSQYQRSLLDMIFMGDTEMRNKFNCIVAKEIKPKLAADDYMDKGEFENELKQVGVRTPSLPCLPTCVHGMRPRVVSMAVD